MEKIKVILVDDHIVFRQGMKMMLSIIDNVEVIADGGNGKELMELLETNTPDIIFMDISMPEMDGIEASVKVKEKDSNIKIIALSTFSNTAYINKMVHSGVEGYMLKNSEVDEFEKAIQKVATGGNYFSEEILHKLTQMHIESRKPNIGDSFSQREVEVLNLICKGMSNREIGSKLFISERTVEKHKTHLLEKSQCSNTVNLVLFAIKNKLVEL